VHPHSGEKDWIEVIIRGKGKNVQGTKSRNTAKKTSIGWKPVWTPRMVAGNNKEHSKSTTTSTNQSGGNLSISQKKEITNKLTPVTKGRNKRLRPCSLSPKGDDVAQMKLIPLGKQPLNALLQEPNPQLQESSKTVEKNQDSENIGA
ncbi:hypothetical protein PIB30_112059, partial [Stylosanthes scabra]|nr:hypothetical protein [Stylosanthes scabra]